MSAYTNLVHRAVEDLRERMLDSDEDYTEALGSVVEGSLPVMNNEIIEVWRACATYDAYESHADDIIGKMLEAIAEDLWNDVYEQTREYDV